MGGLCLSVIRFVAVCSLQHLSLVIFNLQDRHRHALTDMHIFKQIHIYVVIYWRFRSCQPKLLPQGKHKHTHAHTHTHTHTHTPSYSHVKKTFGSSQTFQLIRTISLYLCAIDHLKSKFGSSALILLQFFCDQFFHLSAIENRLSHKQSRDTKSLR